MKLGHKIRSLREQRGLRQIELAATVGASPGMMSHWECGRRKVPFAAAIKLAGALGVGVDDLAASALESERNN